MKPIIIDRLQNEFGTEWYYCPQQPRCPLFHAKEGGEKEEDFEIFGIGKMMTKLLLKKLSHAWNGNQKQSNSATTTTTNVQEARGTYYFGNELHSLRRTAGGIYSTMYEA